MKYTYVLSCSDKQLYVGSTVDLKARLNRHRVGQVPATRNRLPVQLVYYEACKAKRDAIHRERYLKTSHGKHYLKNRLKSYLTG